MSRFSKLFRWINLILILVTFLSYLSPYVHPQTFWPFSFVGIAYPWLLLFNLLFVIFWTTMKDRYLLFSLCCIIMGWGHFTRFVGLNFTDQVTKDSAYVTVMTYNVEYLSFLRNGPATLQKKRRKQFGEMMTRQMPQILCVQESPKYALDLIEEYFKLPYQHAHAPPDKGAAIYSVFPIKKQGLVEFGTSTNSCIWADLQVGKKMLRVYSLHLQSNRISSVADRVLKKGDLQEKETWMDIGGMISNVKRTAAIRAQQAEQVKAHIKKSPYPVLVCGDFNDTPQSYTYRILAEHLNDGFCERGSGIGTTYAGAIPALRIDYILSDPKIEFGACEVLREDFSDHYPVVGKIRFRKKQKKSKE